MTDVLVALVATLRSDEAVAAKAAARVFRHELPRDQVEAELPGGVVVLKRAGGGLLGQSYQEYGDVRVDVTCYGRTTIEAEETHLAVHDVLKQLRRVVSQGTLVHWCRVSSDGTSLRDPDTDYPLVLSSWQVLASEIEA